MHAALRHLSQQPQSIGAAAETFPATFGVSSGSPEKPVTDGGDMNAVRNPGRVAGLWYLLLVLGGPLRLIYIPNKLFVQGDAAATAANIAAHPWLFRFGMEIGRAHV